MNMVEVMLPELNCIVCGLVCESNSVLLGHLETHGTQSVSCLKCQMTFSNLYSFEYHISSSMCGKPNVKEESRYCSCSSETAKKKLREDCVKCKQNKVKLRWCLQCNKTFRFRRHFDKHIEGHRRNNCRYCGELLTNRKALVLHMAERHQIKLLESGYQCKFCDKHFVKRITLYNHYHQHANGQFVCLSCGAFLQTKEELESHKEKHNTERQWHCDQCKETFSRRQQFLIHMEGHKKYKCTICGENFAVKNKLLDHERRKHQLRRIERHHQCSTCGQAFSRPGLLKLHYRTHTGEKPLQCKQCNKYFQTPRGYSNHLAASQHQESSSESVISNLFKCEKCGKFFNQKHILEKHRNRVHGMGQTFKCDFCDHKSNCKENMKRHLALHTEKRQFVCEQCGAAFHTLQALKDHSNYVHSQTRNYICAQCGKSFKRNSGLNRHMATHSESRPFVCSCCGHSYKRASHLRRHKESIHGIVIKSQKLVRLEHDDSGALVPVADDLKTPDSKKSYITVTDNDWEAKGRKIDSANSILSMIGTDEVGTLENLCHHSVNETIVSNSDALSNAIHCAQNAERNIFNGNVMHAIEVSYDMNSFQTPEPLTSVPGTEPQLVFQSSIPVTLEQNHTVLSIHADQVQTSHDPHIDRLQLVDSVPVLHSNDAVKHSNDIFIQQEKSEPVGSTLLNPNVPSHVTLSTSSSLYLPNEALNSASPLLSNSSQESLVTDLHHTDTMLNLHSHMATNASVNRYSLTNSVNGNDCNSLLQTVESVEQKTEATVSSMILNRCIQSDEGANNTTATLTCNNATSITSLSDYLPHQYPFLNV